MTELLTLEEVAGRLRVSTRTVRRLIARGELRPKRIGSRVLMRVIADQLGHADPAITSRIYAHVVPGAQRVGIDALDRALGGDG